MARRCTVARPHLRVGQLGKIKFTHNQSAVVGRAQIRDQDGVRHELSARAASEGQVELLLTRRARAIWDDLPYLGPDTTLASLADAWLRDIETRDQSQLKNSSKAAYATRARMLTALIGDRRLEELTTPFLTRFLEKLS